MLISSDTIQRFFSWLQNKNSICGFNYRQKTENIFIFKSKQEKIMKRAFKGEEKKMGHVSCASHIIKWNKNGPPLVRASDSDSSSDSDLTMDDHETCVYFVSFLRSEILMRFHYYCPTGRNNIFKWIEMEREKNQSKPVYAQTNCPCTENSTVNTQIHTHARTRMQQQSIACSSGLFSVLSFGSLSIQFVVFYIVRSLSLSLPLSPPSLFLKSFR